MDLGRRFRAARKWTGQRLRPKVIAALGLILVLATLLLWQAMGIGQYGQNLALNLGADLIGAIVTIFVISPLITRGQHGRVWEHRRLDYDWFTDQVYHATSDVRILDTFSGLLDRPGTARFLRAATEALRRHTVMRILLLDPDSLAAAQRATELAGNASRSDVRQEILRNLRVLDRFRRGLDEHLRRRFEVRLYAASASVTLYRWDDRALVSFLPIGRLSGDGTQLEITVGSPLGTFVGERFDELWRHGKPLEEFMVMSVTLRDGKGSRRYACEFVNHEDQFYVMSAHVLAHLASTRDETLRASVGEEMTFTYALEVVSGESSVHASLIVQYLEKYERPGQAFIRLRSLAPQPAGHP